MAARLTVVGSVNVDLVARVERLPEPGETLDSASFDRIPGGKGANQAVAAARLGADVELVAAIGDDEFGRLAAEAIDDAGVAPRLKVTGEPTGIAMILVDVEGENAIVVSAGANAQLTADDVAHVTGATLCQLEVPVETVTATAARSERFFLNAAPARTLARDLIDRAEIVIVNRHELDVLGDATPGLVCLTLGAEGAVLLESGEEVARARPPHVDAVDGTAAGDAFTACLVVALLEGREREDALRRACAAGAIAASRFGAQPSLPTAADVDEILARA